MFGSCPWEVALPILSQYKLLLIGRRGGETSLLREKLARNKLYKIEVAEVATEAIERMRDPELNLVLLNLESFTKEKTRLTNEMRDAGHDFPVLILARVIAPDSYKTIEAMERTILLEKPFEEKDLYGLVDKLAQGRRVEQRIHRRFYTNQAAEVLNFRDEAKSPARVFNLSRGGAYLEMENHKMMTGDMVSMNVNLNEMSRSYKVNAKVVWSTASGYQTGRPAVGVEFLKAGDIYRNLLSRL